MNILAMSPLEGFAWTVTFSFILVIIFICILIALIIYLIYRWIKKNIRNVKKYSIKGIDKSQIPDHFKNLFLTLNDQEKKSLNKVKNKVNILTMIQITLGVFLIALVIIGLEIDNSIINFIFLLLFFSFLSTFYIKIAFKNDYTKIFIEIFNPRLLNFINKDITPLRLIDNRSLESKTDYDNSGFYNLERNSTYRSYDIINAMFNNNNIKIRDINVQKIKFNFLSGKYRHETLFNGLFINTKCDFDLGNYVNIASEQVLNRQSSNPNYKFIVSDQNNIDNYNILSYEVLELISKFQNYGINFEITYFNNIINMRLFTDENLKPKADSESKNIEILYLYYLIIEFITSFIEIKKERN